MLINGNIYSLKESSFIIRRYDDPIRESLYIVSYEKIVLKMAEIYCPDSVFKRIKEIYKYRRGWCSYELLESYLKELKSYLDRYDIYPDTVMVFMQEEDDTYYQIPSSYVYNMPRNLPSRKNTYLYNIINDVLKEES